MTQHVPDKILLLSFTFTIAQEILNPRSAAASSVLAQKGEPARVLRGGSGLPEFSYLHSLLPSELPTRAVTALAPYL